MTFSVPNAWIICATTSVRQVSTFSVIPSDSIIIIWAPASRQALARLITHPASRVPSAASSATGVAPPPAPNWIPSSGLALSPAFCHPPYQPQQIVVGNRNETGREFDHVEAESLRFHEVFFDRLGTIA